MFSTIVNASQQAYFAFSCEEKTWFTYFLQSIGMIQESTVIQGYSLPTVSYQNHLGNIPYNLTT